VCVGLRRGHSWHAPNPVTTKKLHIPHDPKEYSMIEQLKTNHENISLYDLISTSETHREIIYALFKKEIVPTNMFAAIFS